MNDGIALCFIELANFALGKGDDEAKFPFRFPTFMSVLAYKLDWPMYFFFHST
jgi:hypothetical protein